MLANAELNRLTVLIIRESFGDTVAVSSICIMDRLLHQNSAQREDVP